jgi:hypothetical protein
MTATTIVLTDGTRADGSSVTCDGCGKPMSDHDCEETKVREKKPRAKPEEKPPCPHCGGAFHFSMPGGLQNTECIMRQFYVDNGTLENPYQRLPVFTLQDLKAAVEWADDLKQPISYGPDGVSGWWVGYLEQHQEGSNRSVRHSYSEAGEEDQAGSGGREDRGSGRGGSSGNNQRTTAAEEQGGCNSCAYHVGSCPPSSARDGARR